MSQSDSVDACVPEDLAAVIHTADPIPFDVLQSLRGSLGRRSSEGELAELVYDSVLDEPSNVRSLNLGRQLSFQGPQISVEMEVVAERHRVIGQLVPAVPGQVEIRHGRGSETIEVDDLGRFVVEGIPKGPVSFRCCGSDDGKSVVTTTDWVVL
jgi:hypothetical protein